MEAMSLLDVEMHARVVLGVEARPHTPILCRAHICKIIAIYSTMHATAGYSCVPLLILIHHPKNNAQGLKGAPVQYNALFRS